MPKYAGGLGFQDIELFNLSLLARQAWRILQNPDTLSARVLKSVYYPDVDFLEATAGNHASQIWRSLVEGKEVLKQGLIRRIGSGERAHAWNDNWLPRDYAMMPFACISKDPPPVRVADFMESASATWKLNRLQEYMLPMDIEVIRAIPICTRQMDDFWSWHYERTGVFSVRSAYRMLVDTRSGRGSGIPASRPYLSSS